MPEYIWEVSHPLHETVQVISTDRLHAIIKACNQWGERWVQIATQCESKYLGEYTEWNNREENRRRKNNGNHKKTKHDAARGNGAGDAVQLGEDAGMEVSGARSDVPHPERREAQRN